MLLRSTDPRRVQKGGTVPTLKLAVRGIKVATLLDPALVAAADLVPPEPAPAGSPVIELELEHSLITVRATLNGKSARRALKAIAEHGVEGCNVLLQGVLKHGEVPGGVHTLDGAGLMVLPKGKPAGEAKDNG